MDNYVRLDALPLTFGAKYSRSDNTMENYGCLDARTPIITVVARALEIVDSARVSPKQRAALVACVCASSVDGVPKQGLKALNSAMDGVDADCDKFMAGVVAQRVEMERVWGF